MDLNNCHCVCFNTNAENYCETYKGRLSWFYKFPVLLLMHEILVVSGLTVLFLLWFVFSWCFRLQLAVCCVFTALGSALSCCLIKSIFYLPQSTIKRNPRTIWSQKCFGGQCQRYKQNIPVHIHYIVSYIHTYHRQFFSSCF